MSFLYTGYVGLSAQLPWADWASVGKHSIKAQFSIWIWSFTDTN